MSMIWAMGAVQIKRTVYIFELVMTTLELMKLSAQKIYIFMVQILLVLLIVHYDVPFLCHSV